MGKKAIKTEELPGVAQIRRRRPAWLKTSRLPAAGMALEVRFGKKERKIFKRRARLRVSEWCERFRYLTMSSAPGLWKNATTPYLTGIMDAAGFPSVQTVILCKAPQVGGSEIAHNFVGWAVDSAPGPVIYVYPDEATARENSKDRILPMFKSSSRLAGYLTGVSDDAASLRINLTHLPIYLAWARSASRLGNKPARYVIFDEVDKYPPTAGKKEADPISLGEKRTITYSDQRKIWKISTPTVEAGNIWTALNQEAQVVFLFQVYCPECGAAQVMEFDRIRWPEDQTDPETVEQEGLARYACSGCDLAWDDHMRNVAVASGEWVDRDTGRSLFDVLNKRRPRKIGFHLPSWLSRFISLSAVAAAFLRGKGDKEKLKDFCNNHKAEPWLDYKIERKEDRVLALRDDRPRGLVPRWAPRLTAGIDTQDQGFYYEIRAWGWGQDLESWLVREGFVEDFEALDRVLFEDRYEDADGQLHQVLGGMIDSGGHRTADVYDWCRMHPTILPVKGKSTGRSRSAPVTPSHIDFYPGTKKRIPGGLTLYLVDTHHFKDLLAGKLAVNPDDPGAWHLHADVGQDYAEQLCVEYRDERDLWQCPKGRANHYWDCSNYNLAYVEYRGFRYEPEPGAVIIEKPAGRKPAEKPRRW